MASPFKVSQSRVNKWLTCKLQHYFRYVEKLERKKIRRPFMFGRIVHSMMEADAEGEDPFDTLEQIAIENQRLFQGEQEMYGDLVSDIEMIMDAYFEYWPEKDIRFIRRNKRSAEHYFEIELPGDILWNGYVDAYGKTPNKLQWLVENKSFSKLPNEDHRWRNLQSVTYIRATQMLGWVKGDLDGTLWNYVRSTPPKRPQVTQKGKLSTRKVNTLPEAIREVIRDQGFKMKDYKKLIQTATEGQDRWFLRIYTPVSTNVVDMMFSDFVETAQEIMDYGEKLPKRSLGRHCEYCDFEAICRAELTGGDVAYVKEKEYKIRHEKVNTKSEIEVEAN